MNFRLKEEYYSWNLPLILALSSNIFPRVPILTILTLKETVLDSMENIWQSQKEDEFHLNCVSVIYQSKYCNLFCFSEIFIIQPQLNWFPSDFLSIMFFGFFIIVYLQIRFVQFLVLSAAFMVSTFCLLFFLLFHLDPTSF